jgi:transposase
MTRLMLSDEFWSKLKIIMLQHGIYDKSNLRTVVEGVFYRMRVGCPWRDLPSTFGPWNSVYKQFNRWSLKEKFMKIFKSLVEEPDLEWEFIDGSFIKAHQHSAGACSDENQAIGKSKGGNTTKIHMAVDAFGLPIEFELTGGEVHDCKMAPQLIKKLSKADYVIADKGYDSEALRELIREKSSIPMIPRKSNSKQGNDDMDWNLYKNRHLVENVFARLKHFRAIATRYDKLKRNYFSMLAIACSYLWLPM